MKNRKMKMLVAFTLCLSGCTAMSQDQGAKLSIALMSVTPDTLSVYDGEDVYHSTLNKDGKFLFNLKAGKGGREISVTMARPERARLAVYITDKSKLEIVTDMTDTASFSGVGASEARLFNQNYWYCLKAWRAITVKDKTPDDLYNTFYAMFSEPLRVLEANKNKVSAAFYTEHYNFLFYQQMGYLLDVPFWYQRETGAKLSESVPEKYWTLIDKLQLNGDVVNSDFYRSTMTVSLPFYLENEYKFKSGHPDDSTFSEHELFNYTYRRLEALTGGATRNYVLKARLEGRISQVKDPAILKPLLDEYEKKYATPDNIENVKSLKEQYAKALQMMPGKEPAHFVVKDRSGKEVALKDFSGKVLYIDFWASWCSPCRAEMKSAAPKLQSMFKDSKELVFLYINLDKAQATAEKAIAEDNIKGVHLFGGDFNSSNPVAQAFNISGIPHYVIIGKDGKIFDVDAPRPSDEKTPERLREALNAE
jgi:Thiol-disulfide isomerase and thioredoxins